jgi:hypothetical protein
VRALTGFDARWNAARLTAVWPRMTTWLRRALAGATIALQLAALAHLVLAPHGTCPLDGDVVHVAPIAPTRSIQRSPHAAVRDRAPAAPDETSCATAVAAFEAAAVLRPTPRIARTSPPAADTRVACGADRLDASAPRLWRLAPKQGPPA